MNGTKGGGKPSKKFKTPSRNNETLRRLVHHSACANTKIAIHNPTDCNNKLTGTGEMLILKCKLKLVGF